MMADEEEVVDFRQQNQWEAGPDEEIKIPEAYITRLQYEIVILSEKKTFTFRCVSYETKGDGEWLFGNVIIDSSKRDAKGKVDLQRISYHPELSLVNVSFMVLPAPEEGLGD